MYNVGTVTTTANSTKLVGVGTKWKDNNSRVSAEQVILIQNGATIYINSIASIQSNTEITLSFPEPASVSNAPYQILTTMVNSVSDAANKIVAMNVANVQFSDILNRWATESGTITVTLPDGTTQQLRTAKEMDKQLDGKFDKTGGTISGDVTFSKNAIKSTKGTHTLPAESGTLMQVGDYGVGVSSYDTSGVGAKNESRFVQYGSTPTAVSEGYPAAGGGIQSSYTPSRRAQLFLGRTPERLYYRFSDVEGVDTTTTWKEVYSTANTTKDSNGNLKAASPIVKVFAEHIETNDEAEGVTMQKLGVGHYLIKGVVGFNADGAWGIDNGFVIPQDHNGKNMVIIDYKVRPDGDIEVFVFHQQNTDLPERFQNKRIKYIDKDGNPVYFENYEPCDVPESRWIDMRVEMPVNSIYNLKQAEAERLAKEEADKQAEEEAKNAEIEAEEDI
ncbi:cell envelope integrity protein TolA [Providencia stuartii]|uniref:cell envelope integrity protein TolA n=1 Tax=Providencia stuartii TaxID=588 RepID=UPI00288EAB0B|nr:cell envelope integrity protein TolA [Providencia stuartii]MDT2016436.1 cell envelope integrity protein TolA [Providencia stuartii]MDT2083031.1 cell envelope integrity protein TolA [Providencia stuartii]